MWKMEKRPHRMHIRFKAERNINQIKYRTIIKNVLVQQHKLINSQIKNRNGKPIDTQIVISKSI